MDTVCDEEQNCHARCQRESSKVGVHGRVEKTRHCVSLEANTALVKSGLAWTPSVLRNEIARTCITVGVHGWEEKRETVCQRETKNAPTGT